MEQKNELNGGDRGRRFIKTCLIIACVAAIVYVVFEFAIPLLLPFIIAFCAAAIIRPLIRFFTNTCKIPKIINALFFTLLFYATVGVLAVLLGAQLFFAVRDWVIDLPSWFQNTLVPAITSLVDTINDGLDNINPEIAGILEQNWRDISGKLVGVLSDYATKVAEKTANIAISIPNALLMTVVTVISTFFMAKDSQLISKFIEKQFSGKALDIYHKVLESIRTVIFDYMKSYSLILVVTFLELWLGLTIVGIRNAVVLAVLIALFDIMPIVGSGMIMFPWAVVTLIQGPVTKGIGLLIVWAVVVVFRQYLEPRIIGMNIGLHPVVTLIGMITGLSLFGAAGLFGFLGIIAILRALNEQGVISIYKRLTTKEKEEAKKIPPKKKKTKAERRAAFRKFFTKLPDKKTPKADDGETKNENKGNE